MCVCVCVCVVCVCVFVCVPAHPLFLQDSIVHGVVAVSLFAGAVALATYIPDVKSLSQGMFASTFARVVSAAEATCVSCGRRGKRSGGMH